VYQFADFARWQQQYLRSSAVGAAVEYWKRQWEEYEYARVTLDELGGQGRLGIGSNKGTMEATSIEQPVAEALRRYARKMNVTLYMLLLATLYIALHNRTGRKKIAIHGVFANRARPEVEDMIGYFGNGHLLGISIDSDASVESILPDVRKVVLDGVSCQEMPTGHLWRVLGRAPRFTDPGVTYDLWRFKGGQQTSALPPGITNISAEPLFLGGAPISGRLNANAYDMRDEIALSLHFDPGVLNRTAMRQLLEQWAEVTRKVITDHEDATVG
jgi:hypothetical protein